MKKVIVCFLYENRFTKYAHGSGTEGPARDRGELGEKIS